VEGRLLLDVVVRQRTAVLQLLAGEDQALLVWGNTCYVEGRGLGNKTIERKNGVSWLVWFRGQLCVLFICLHS
jgi:hypothetical protein